MRKANAYSTDTPRVGLYALYYRAELSQTGTLHELEGDQPFLGLVHKLIDTNPTAMLKAIKVALREHERKKGHHMLLYVRYNKKTMQRPKPARQKLYMKWIGEQKIQADHEHKIMQELEGLKTKVLEAIWEQA